MRWKCLCAYDGTDFDGWQRQPSGNGIQNVLEVALSGIFDREILTHGSGRTDAGVHARGQCFHFDGDWSHDSGKLVRAIHANLPTSIRIESVRKVRDDFHARHSAKGKRYMYFFHLGRANPFEDRFVWSCRPPSLDLPAMEEAAEHLVGTHDFSAFAASHSKDSDPNPVKTITRVELKHRSKTIRLTTEGSGYLYRMVRSFAGALHAVGRGQLTPADIRTILEARERTHRIVTAPAKGLCLERVFY